MLTPKVSIFVFLAGALLNGALIVALTGAAWAAQAPVSSAPTFYRDVLPILQTHCQECHRPGESAPMAFTSYAQVRP